MRTKLHETGRALARLARGCAVAMAALAVGALLATPGTAGAQNAEAGVQVTPDMARILVSKDVGTERWAITRNDDGTVTGNVFPLDGGPPAFVWCEQKGDGNDLDDFFDDFIDFLDDLIGNDDGDDGTDDELTFSCFGSDACTDVPCTPDEWTYISDVTLPESFFRP